jgi:hypothetical protein
VATADVKLARWQEAKLAFEPRSPSAKDACRLFSMKCSEIRPLFSIVPPS